MAAAGGHVGGGVKVWCGERAASGRVASESVVFFDATRANFGTIDQGAPPQARMPLPIPWLGWHPLPEVIKVTDVRYGPPYLPPENDSLIRPYVVN